jgi:hypothetical protein
VWRVLVPNCHTLHQRFGFQIVARLTHAFANRPTVKTPTAKILKPTVSEDMTVEVSSKGSPTSNKEEIHALRARNKVLTDALKAIKETADKEVSSNYELVWFARHRGKYQIGSKGVAW